MKAFVSAIALLAAICVFVGIHSYIMQDMADSISAQCKNVSALAQNDNWEAAVEKIDHIRSIWDKRRMWSALTITTKEIEQIEIALTQSRAYAELRQKPDFFGEFILFTKLVEHIPHQEAFHIEEVL